MSCHRWRLALPGISKYEVSLDKQEVLVEGMIHYDDLLEKIEKTGKEVGSFVICLHLIFTAKQVRSGQINRNLNFKLGELFELSTIV